MARPSTCTGRAPAVWSWPPPKRARVCGAHGSAHVVMPTACAPIVAGRAVRVTCVGLDVRRDSCEVAIATAGEVRAGTSPRALKCARPGHARREHTPRSCPRRPANALTIQRAIEPHLAQPVPTSPDTVPAASQHRARRRTRRAEHRRCAAGSPTDKRLPWRGMGARWADQRAPAAGLTPNSAGASAYPQEHLSL